MTKFRTQFVRVRKYTEPGSEELTTYTLKDDFTLQETGVKNIQDEIRSHRASVELATLLQRYAQGDETALNKKPGFFADVSDLPESLIEWNDSFRTANDQFNKLPADIRAAFNNNAAEFWTSFGTEAFAKTLTQVGESRDSKYKKKGSVPNNNNNPDDGNTSGGNGGSVDE